MRKLNSQFVTKFISEAGLEQQNGTYYGFVELDQFYCMAVAEGYDDEGGQESARLAVDTAMEAFVRRPGLSAGRLEGCLKEAHRRLKEQSVRIKLKAGILLYVSDYTKYRYASCGNIMLFHLRGNSVLHQSITHTVYQSMQEELERREGSKEAPPEETRNLYSYLGGSARFLLSPKLKLQEEDAVLIVTERFWNRVGRIEVLDAFESFRSAEEFLGDLQELYLRGSTEFIGCYCLAALTVQKVYRENKSLRKKVLLLSFLLILAIILAVSFFLFLRQRRLDRLQEVRYTLSSYEENGDKYLVGLNGELASQQYEKAIDAGKELSVKEEQLASEKELTDKISLSTSLTQAEEAYEAMEFQKSDELYREVLMQLKPYSELAGLHNAVDSRRRLVQYGIEIDTYMESAALKEAQGELEDAITLYKRAEAMLRIADYPSLLKEVQLSLLRVEEAAGQETRQDEASGRDKVILEADAQAALEAALAEDYATAVALYTQIRDGYVELEENDKAKEISMLITLLQKQEQNSRQEEASLEFFADRLLKLQEEALEAVLIHDYQAAEEKYDQIIQIYIACKDDQGAAMAEAARQYLEQRQGEEAANGP